MVDRCPHGDTTCPCVDGDSCHYEGDRPMACPTMTDLAIEVTATRRAVFYVGAVAPHCHVEGCKWPAGGCGLLRIRPSTILDDAYRMGCGRIRTLVADSR